MAGLWTSRIDLLFDREATFQDVVDLVQNYEIITILPAGDLARLDEIKTRVREILSRNKVEVLKEEDLGIRRLPHEINGVTSGAFLLQNCKVEPASVKDITRDLQIEEGIMRYMVKRVA